MMKRFLTFLMFVLLVTGCGYHAPGHDESWVGGGGQTLFVDLFANRTPEPYLDNYVTGSVVRQLARSRLVELTEDRNRADLLLTGVITHFDSSATAYNRVDRISDYRISMRVSVRLSDRVSDQVVWQDELRLNKTYPATTDKNLQLEGRSLAAREATDRLAEDLYARLLDAF
jgi:outer membrane lipopolysaccharide assembly protein LptE/RlpB